MTQPPVCHKPAHGCIIMASGMGTRFGSNKLMAELDGVPLIQHVIRATDGLFSRRVVVARHVEVAEVCRVLEVEVILHNEPHRNDTVRLGMEGMDGCATVTFVQADQPLISPASIATLLRRAEEGPEFIWRASFEGTPGAPVLFPAWTFDELRVLPLGKGGGWPRPTRSVCGPLRSPANGSFLTSTPSKICKCFESRFLDNSRGRLFKLAGTEVDTRDTDTKKPGRAQN